jgi:hypothetical protein
MVSGIAALLLAVNGNLQNDDLANIIRRTATDIYPWGPDSLTGAGLANAHRAVEFISSPRVVHHGTVSSSAVSVVATSGLYPKTFENLGFILGDPDLPDEPTQFLVRRLTLQGRATFGPPWLRDIRNIWVRHKNGLSPGWPDEDPMDCVLFVGTGTVDSSSWDSTSVTLQTYTFALYQASDTSFVRYVPIHPDSVEIPYTAVLGHFDEVPFVEVHAPNGGENWVGGNREITWEAFDDDTGIDSVSIFWSLDSGEQWPRTLAAGITADTSWIWALVGEDTTGSSTSRIAVVAYDGGMDMNYDMSDSDFRVVTAQDGGPLLSYTSGRASAPLEPDAWVGAEGVLYLYLPRAGRTEVAVYDVRGRRVKTLVSQPLARGFHAVAWDGRDVKGNRVASGIYFYQFRTNDYHKTGKLLVLR